ncbi:MAG TPA: hypothetical protein VKZ94_03650 [Advenella sp.]|nr:hypothetical protein [Advenella sp.]
MGVEQPAELQKKMFEHAMLMLETQTTSFAYMFIKDNRLRQLYVENIHKMSLEYRALVDLGKLTPEQGAVEANKLRNEILELTRRGSSPIARKYAKALKPTGRSWDYMKDYKAGSIFNGTFDQLNASEQNTVYKAIIDSSGKSDEYSTRIASVLGKYGRGLFVVSIVIAAYDIYESDNKAREAAKQVTVAGGSIIVGYGVGGIAAATVCAAANIGCVAVATVAGALVGGLGVEAVFDGLF